MKCDEDAKILKLLQENSSTVVTIHSIDSIYVGIMYFYLKKK